MAQDQRSRLLDAATSFCQAFATQAPPDKILLNHFSGTESISVLEHGLPQLAPFLGREFTGADGVRKYFALIAGCLAYRDMRFSNYVVDPVTNKVSVRGQARFTWTATGQGWDEVFTYVLAFDHDFKVTSYEIWADSGAAYLASKGQL